MIELDTIRERVDGVIREQMNADQVPGMAWALTDREHTLWVAARGYADLTARIPLTTDMLFAIGSIGKSFTSIALLQEHETGNLDLDQPSDAISSMV